MNDTRFTALLTERNIPYQTDLPLAPYTSFKIGGKAKAAVFPDSREAAERTLAAVRESGERCLILGNATNVLIDDNGFDGVAVIFTKLHDIHLLSDNGDTRRISAEAGCPLTSLSLFAEKENLTGLEFAYGIPGTVGGGIYMNAGAFGGDMSQVTVRSQWYDLSTGETGESVGDEQRFSYRHSIYMDTDRVILSAEFLLSVGERDRIHAVMHDNMTRRVEHQPLEYPSAGSVFKRGNGFITAKLIEDAGLKGRRVGGAEVSVKHAGFIVNRGGATADDVMKLVEIIQNELAKQFRVAIECEIRVIR